MKRRNFLKLLGVGAAIVAIPVIPTFETTIYDYPEVRAVLNKFPEDLFPNEKLAIARFVTDSIKDGTWDLISSFSQFFPKSEANSLVDWKQN